MASRRFLAKSPQSKFITGYRPVIHAREGRMLGMQHAADAIAFCMNVTVSHYDSRLGMSDARIERFEGMVSA
jgi:hypothetical protein